MAATIQQQGSDMHFYLPKEATQVNNKSGMSAQSQIFIHSLLREEMKANQNSKASSSSTHSSTRKLKLELLWANLFLKDDSSIELFKMSAW